MNIFNIIIYFMIAESSLVFSLSGMKSTFQHRTLRSSSLLMKISLKSDVAIIGGGPAGLSTAIMLSRRGYKNINVYEKLSEPPSLDDPIWNTIDSERTYNIGISGRGQNVLRHIDAMDTVEKHSTSVIGRIYWEPETAPEKPLDLIWTNRSYVTKCIPRDCLASCLVHEIKSKYSDTIQLHFGVQCYNVTWNSTSTSSGNSNTNDIITDDDDSDNDETCQIHLRKTATSALNPTTTTTNIDDSSSTTTNSISGDSWIETPSWVVGADGASSAVRESMVRTLSKDGFYAKKYKDTNIRVYRTIPLYFDQDSSLKSDIMATSTTTTTTTTSPSSASSSTTTSTSDNIDMKDRRRWRLDVNYSARTKSDINIDALPLKNGPYLGVVLYRPWDERITTLTNGNDAKEFFNQVFPMFTPFIRDEDYEIFAKKKDSKLPVFSYVGPYLHKGKTACLLGDTIHTVKPYFGLGLNSALEDVKILEESLESHKDDLKEALKSYSIKRAKDTKALVEMSKTLDGGFLTFILPLIIDSIFHKKLPVFFAPNTITLLQNEKLSFTQVLNRKRLDRVLQTSFVLFGIFAIKTILFSMFKFLRILSRTRFVV